MELSKKDWVCRQPFEFLEIFEHGTFMCCPDWLPQNLGLPIDIGENWRSEKANKIRESILDGSYSYCVEKKCPKLIFFKTRLNLIQNDSIFTKKKKHSKVPKIQIRIYPDKSKFLVEKKQKEKKN